MSDFGTGFKKARESRGISLEEIAAETRIGTRFLQAIESENFQRLPGGVFNRGFIRAYAERVGLDPVQALAEYERLVNSSDVETSSGPPQRPRSRIGFALYPIAIGALVLLTIGFYVLQRNPSTPEVAATAPAPVIAPEPVVQAAPEPVQPGPTSLPQQLAIQMDAKEDTWIRLSTDGAPFVEEILNPGDTRRFTAAASIDITIGNAGGITFKVNNREVKTLGPSGKVRAFVITPENAGDIG